MLKRITLLALALVLVLTACGGETKSDKDPQALNAAYTAAITAAQTADEQEAFPQITPDHDMYQPLLDVMGIAPEDMTASAFVVSMRGIQAYSIVAIMPAPDKGDTIRRALEDYIESQKTNFQFYLEDQYDIAANAKLEELSDGTLLLVMCDNQDQVLARIRTALEA